MCAERESAVSPAVAVALILALTTLVAGIVTVTVLSGGLSFVVKDAKEVQVSVDIAGDTAVLSIVSGKDLPMMSSYTVIVTDINGVAYNGTLPYPAVKSVKFPMNSGEVGLWIQEIEDSGVTVPGDVKTEVTAAVGYLSKILNVNNISQIAVVGHFTDGISEVVFLGQVKPGAVVEPITPATQYTITFEANGGSGTQYVQYVPQGESFILPTNGTCKFTGPEKTSFGWWSLNQNGDEPHYSADESYNPSADTIFYAAWIYNITYHANDGTPSEQKFTYNWRGLNATAKDSTIFTPPSGQQFTAWNTQNDGMGISYNPGAELPKEHLDLYAIWETVTSHTITYHANNGSSVTTTQSVTGSSATTLGADTFTPPLLQKFSTWNTQYDGKGTSYNAESPIPVSGDMDLYAQWSYPQNGGYNNGSLHFTNIPGLAQNISNWYNTTYGASGEQVVISSPDNTGNSFITFNNQKPIYVSQPLSLNDSTIGEVKGQLAVTMNGKGGIVRYPGYTGDLIVLGGTGSSNRINIGGTFVIDGDKTNTSDAVGSALVIKNSATVSIEDGASLTVKNNSNSTGNGGGIYVESGGSIEIKKDGTLNITGNIAGENGGGIYMEDGEDFKKNNGKIKITYNHAGTSGGGVYVYQNWNNFPLSSSTISDNTKGPSNKESNEVDHP